MKLLVGCLTSSYMHNNVQDDSVMLVPYCLVLHVTCMAMHSSLTGPQPPRDVSAAVTGDGTAVVSWCLSLSGLCDVVIGNYSVRYQQKNIRGGYTTVHSSRTSVTLQDLVPNAEYNVSVAAIYPNGDMSAFSALVQFTVTPTAPLPCEALVMLHPSFLSADSTPVVLLLCGTC